MPDFAAHPSVQRVRMVAAFPIHCHNLWMLKPFIRFLGLFIFLIASFGTAAKTTKTPSQSAKDAFNLARNLYVQGKYELCVAELEKVHKELPNGFENSKELETFCKKGKDIVDREKAIDREKRIKAL